MKHDGLVLRADTSTLRRVAVAENGGCAPAKPRRADVFSLQKIRSELNELGSELRALVEGPTRTLLEKSQELLRAQVWRVAVVGQVKAGKSTFINALVGRPSLLPTDVNPWTTAVTRLHFRDETMPRGPAAEFTFFQPDEWQRLASGGGRIRELTEQLVPGFEPALLGSQLQAMRAHAAARLGPEFDRLLGTAHRYSEITTEIIARYVCAGAASGHPVQPLGPGHYADLVRSADIYLDGAPFVVPGMIIDTPGTNDPFLVRDEITRQSLDGADLYIVVLTAHQALSTSDLTLLRILRGLHKERIIVFINRIDELSGLPTSAVTMAAQVRRNLQAEFPGVEIPIVLGSAHWAIAAQSADAMGRHIDITPQMRAWAGNLGSPETARVVHMAGHSQVERTDQARAVLVCSGIPDVLAALSQPILRSHASHTVKHVAATFREMARLGELSAKIENGQLDATGAGFATPLSLAQEKEKLAAETDRLKRMGDRLEMSFKHLQATLGATVDRETSTLASALHAALEKFAASECIQLSAAIQEGLGSRSWRCDTAPVRRFVEGEFLHLFRAAEEKILHAEGNIFLSLREIVSHALPDAASGAGLSLQPVPFSAPSIGALGKVMTLDLDEPWWRAWWTGRRSEHERVEHLKQLIKSELISIIEDLERTARLRLREQTTATLDYSETICRGLIDALRKQSERHIATLTELQGSDGATRAGEQTLHVERREELRRRLEQWRALAARLEDLHRRCDAIVQ